MNREKASCIYGSYVPKMNRCEVSSSISHFSGPPGVFIVTADFPQRMSLAYAGLSPLNRYFTGLGKKDASVARRWGNIIFPGQAAPSMADLLFWMNRDLSSRFRVARSKTVDKRKAISLVEYCSI